MTKTLIATPDPDDSQHERLARGLSELIESRATPRSGLSDFTLVTTMDQLVRHLWRSGSERTEWDGVGLTFEEPYGWAIEGIQFDPTNKYVQVTIHFMKVS